MDPYLPRRILFGPCVFTGVASPVTAPLSARQLPAEDAEGPPPDDSDFGFRVAAPCPASFFVMRLRGRGVHRAVDLTKDTVFVPRAL